MTLDLWSILIIVVAFQGLFLLSIILTSKGKSKRYGNRFLALIILTLIWFLAEFFCVRNKIDVGLSVFYGTRYGSWFLLGPLIYFYFQSITEPSWRFSKKLLWHFIPFVVFVVIIPFIAYKTLDNRQIDYGMLSSFDHREKSLTTLQWTYSVIFVLQFVHLGYFLINNLRMVKSYEGSLTKEYSNINKDVKWLSYFNVILISLLVLVAVFLYILLITDIYRRHLDYIYVLPIGLIFYVLSYKFMRTQWQPIEKNGKYATSTFNQEFSREYAVKLNRIVNEEKVYLDAKLRLKDLADKMNISTHHLSQLLNQEVKLSFFDFINRHRIQEAKKLIDEHSNLTLLQVAYDAGFNNKTSFVNAFKKFESMTPSKYREQQHS